MNYSELLQHILRQYSLYLYNVRILTKILFQRFFTSPYPDFHFGIHIKCTGSFYRKTFYGTIGYRQIFSFLTRHSLNILNDQTLIGKYPLVPYQLISPFNTFSSQSNAPNSFCKLAISISETFPKIVFMIPILIFIFCFQILFSRKINRKSRQPTVFSLFYSSSLHQYIIKGLG